MVFKEVENIVKSNIDTKSFEKYLSKIKNVSM